MQNSRCVRPDTTVATAGSAATKQDSRQEKKRDIVRQEEILIETFDALVRDLVTWQLVLSDKSTDQDAWKLVPRAQERLKALAAT
jgi:hypothetical protein